MNKRRKDEIRQRLAEIKVHLDNIHAVLNEDDKAQQKGPAPLTYDAPTTIDEARAQGHGEWLDKRLNG